MREPGPGPLTVMREPGAGQLDRSAGTGHRRGPGGDGPAADHDAPPDHLDLGDLGRGRPADQALLDRDQRGYRPPRLRGRGGRHHQTADPGDHHGDRQHHRRHDRPPECHHDGQQDRRHGPRAQPEQHRGHRGHGHEEDAPAQTTQEPADNPPQDDHQDSHVTHRDAAGGPGAMGAYLIPGWAWAYPAGDRGSATGRAPAGRARPRANRAGVTATCRLNCRVKCAWS